MKRGFSFQEPAGLGNQLVVLYHVYNTCPDVEDLYFPHMDGCRHYFNCDKFRGFEYFKDNYDKFDGVRWEDTRGVDDLLRFNDLQLALDHQTKVQSMVSSLGNGDLVAIHMRHGDYIEWNQGKLYFSKERYMDEANKAIASWGLDDPTVVVFSDEKKDGVKFSWDLTGGDRVYDLFLMSHFNYFIRTHSTFSGTSSHLSRNRGLFKGEVIISN